MEGREMRERERERERQKMRYYNKCEDKGGRGKRREKRKEGTEQEKGREGRGAAAPRRSFHGYADMKGADSCGHAHLVRLWSPLWSHETCKGVPKWEARTHADMPKLTFGGAPCGATILLRGAPKWASRLCAGGAPRFSVELLVGPRSSREACGHGRRRR